MWWWWQRWRRCFGRPAMNQKRFLDATPVTPLQAYTNTHAHAKIHTRTRAPTTSPPVDVVAAEEYLCGRKRVNHFNYDRGRRQWRCRWYILGNVRLTVWRGGGENMYVETFAGAEAAQHLGQRNTYECLVYDRHRT